MAQVAKPDDQRQTLDNQERAVGPDASTQSLSYDQFNRAEITGVPQASSAVEALLAAPRNRYLRLNLGTSGRTQAIRVVFSDLPPPFDIRNGAVMWVGEPFEISTNGHRRDPTPDFSNFLAASLSCDPVLRDWGATGPVEVFHRDIVPGAVYFVEVVDSDESTAVAESVVVTTGRWGDAVGPYDAQEQTWTAPDGRVDVGIDVVAILDTFRSLPGAPPKALVDFEPATPDGAINITDVTFVLEAFTGRSYPFAPGLLPCP